MDALRISNVSKKYGKLLALDHVSLHIEKGLFGLLGANGAGKTTLMRIIATLLPMSDGEIRYGTLNWNEPQKIRELIGYLPQKFSLYEHIKVHEALHHIAALKGVHKQHRAQVVDDAIEKTNLEEQRYKKIGSLSGGMVRRVGIAQAILGFPKIIVVDEPTAGLDPEERVRFRILLRSLGKEAIVILSTHIIEDVESICDRVAILHKGKILITESVQDIGKAADGFAQPTLEDVYLYLMEQEK